MHSFSINKILSELNIYNLFVLHLFGFLDTSSAEECLFF